MAIKPYAATSSISRLIFSKIIFKKPPIRPSSTFPCSTAAQTLHFPFPRTCRFFSSSRTVQELLAKVEREKQREREQRIRVGLDVKDIEAEDDEDYMGVGSLIEKLEKEKLKGSIDLNKYEEPTDSDSDEDIERFSTDAVRKRSEVFEKKFKRHGELLNNFAEAGTLLNFICFLFSVTFSAIDKRKNALV